MQDAKKIESNKDLIKIKNEFRDEMALRTGEVCKAKDKYVIMMCFGTSCIASGVQAVKEALLKELELVSLSDQVKIKDKISIGETGCNGFCAAGPLMVVYPGGYFYQKLKPEDMKEFVNEHLIGGKPVKRLMYYDIEQKKHIPLMKEIPFFSSQKQIALRNRGLISAENLDEYISRDGYFGFAQALKMKPKEIIDVVIKSGLRGRGGGGFLTGRKWSFCLEKEKPKYIICNADEGDPGAFMDRSIIESDPHSLLEGMMIGGLAIGANEGFIYCRAEYPLAVKRLKIAINSCRERGLLGKNILGSKFSFDISIVQGSGAFVCGEETALMNSIEGKRGEPRPRPPFPAVKGLWGRPSVLNNVETFANVPFIIRKGADEFKSSGTDSSTGTKVFALCGNVNNVGLVEVPMGTTLGELIYDIGGGIPNGKRFKAAQIGGPSGGCIPKEHLGVSLDFESVTKLGAIMGSGGLIVMDESTCMVDVARYFMEFVQEESCGKCTPCRVGTKRLLEILTRICNGEGEEKDLERLEDLAKEVQRTALCGLGKTAGNPVLSTIRYFRDEYIEHIKNKRCPAGVCPGLTRAPCQSSCPAGVDVPGFISLVGEKRFNEALAVHRNRNPFAQICARVCFHPCEIQCRRSTIDDAVSIRSIKRYMVEKEKESQLPEIRKNIENSKYKIAIIGAGPAGLSCGYFLARLGYMPDIFEAEEIPGGMLVQAIPEYRLPRKSVESEIRMIEQLGVKIFTNKKLGRDFSIQDLQDQGYKAVFIAIGAPDPVDLRIPGNESTGVINALDFLKEYNLNKKLEIGNKVIVIGGGNAAIDAARTAVRLGASDVRVIYRRTRKEMPAWTEEIEEAEREGVKIEELVSPLEIISVNGKVKSLKYRKMILGDYDSSGRRKPVEDKTKDFSTECDQIITAISQRLDLQKYLKNIKIEVNKNNFIKVDDKKCVTSVPWVFAGGDSIYGPSSVVEAIATGEKAAASIDEYLTGEEHAFWRNDKTVDTFFDPDADPIMDERGNNTYINIEKRRRNFNEVEEVWSDKFAIRQTKRCLRCDYVDNCDH